MIAALSPAAANYQETLSTRNFARDCEAVKAQVKVNHMSVEDELKEDIRLLKEELVRCCIAIPRDLWNAADPRSAWITSRACAG